MCLSGSGRAKHRWRKDYFYKDLGIYRVLLTLTDKEAIKEYLADTVAPLYEYDEMNHSDLVRVLQCYLANDCSVKSASQELIVHRNTINYKIGKAAEILGKIFLILMCVFS